MPNGTMMQYFEWYLPSDGSLWKRTAAEAKTLAERGITAVWLPPASKGQSADDVGYGTYDLYDLGEFDQKGTVRTKYGTKEEYLAAIRALHEAGIQVYADMVFDHKMGADYTEQVQAVEDNGANRFQPVSGEQTIEAWTGFSFPGRNGKYSDFKWNHTHFDGVDWDQRSKHSAIYNFAGTAWDAGVDNENANYDYLMGADLCFSNREVVEELGRYGQWFLDTAKVDGFRLDAVKHIQNDFFKGWLGKLRSDNTKELFTVGEYWSTNVNKLEGYLRACEGCMSLFDVPLHFNFFNVCQQGQAYDMRRIFDGTLVQQNPAKAVTFVANHDTQKGQALETVIADWFKPLAYALILLRPQGYPCVFYGDYYGVACKGVPPFAPIIDKFLAVRRDALYGAFHDYLDHPDVLGWTLEGDAEHPHSGCAVLVDNGPAGEKRMYVGTAHAGQIYCDCTGSRSEEICIGADGFATFFVTGGNVSVWCEKR